jgi:hypothetical protein
MKAIKFYQDPGHGWIAVPSGALALAGLTKNDFTSCSYQSKKGTMLYLEEDCDATTFVQAFEVTFGFKPYFIEQHSNKRHWIRSLPQLETTKAELKGMSS